MIKSLVAAAALTIGLAGYAVAQEAAPARPPPLRWPMRCTTTIIITITIITITTIMHHKTTTRWRRKRRRPNGRRRATRRWS